MPCSTRSTLTSSLGFAGPRHLLRRPGTALPTLQPGSQQHAHGFRRLRSGFCCFCSQSSLDRELTLLLRLLPLLHSVSFHALRSGPLRVSYDRPTHARPNRGRQRRGYVSQRASDSPRPFDAHLLAFLLLFFQVKARPSASTSRPKSQRRSLSMPPRRRSAERPRARSSPNHTSSSPRITRLTRRSFVDSFSKPD